MRLLFSGLTSEAIRVATFTAVCFLCSPVSAQPSQMSDEEYDGLIKQGVSEFAAGNWAASNSHSLGNECEVVRRCQMVSYPRQAHNFGV